MAESSAQLPDDIREFLQNRPDPNQLDSGTTLEKFNPKVIPYQWEVVKLIRKDFDHSSGTPFILLSGAYGSAKSILMAHLAVTHCLFYSGAKLALVRRAMPDLKRTIFKEVLEHLGYDSNEETGLEEGRDYWVNKNESYIRFRNGSEIIGLSWADKKYDRPRSLKLSAAVIEEITENDDEDKQGYDELVNRVRRLPGIHEQENFVIAACNPDEPEHWVYSNWIENEDSNHFVFYSKTYENPYIDAPYIENQFRTLSPRQVQRYVYGLWVELTKDVIYYEYKAENNYVNRSYEIDPRHPVWINWDFNIGQGKPLSLCLFQYFPKQDTFHVFGELILPGARTLESCEQLAWHGFLRPDIEYKICGDATGKANDTRSIKSDWDIIEEFFANYQFDDGSRINFDMEQPVSNPPRRTRHNIVNAYCQNAFGENRLFVYRDAWTVHRGLKLTSFKKNSIEEDDSKEYQHVTTALGYGMLRCLRLQPHQPGRKKVGNRGPKIETTNR